MATFNYQKSQDTATRLITKFGRTMTVRDIVEGAYDPSTGSTSITITDNDTVGVEVNLPSNMLNEKLQDGSLVQLTDKMVLLKSLVAPTLTDRLVIGSEVFTISNIDKISPASIVVLYKLIIRNG